MTRKAKTLGATEILGIGTIVIAIPMYGAFLDLCLRVLDPLLRLEASPTQRILALRSISVPSSPSRYRCAIRVA